MGLLADFKAVKDVQRIKAGGTAKLSIAQITNLIVNLPDAEKNLPAQEFKSIYALYGELRKCTTKMEMDMNGYLGTVVDIIKRFDVIAPYEKYSGGNELELSFLMNEIRKLPDDDPNALSEEDKKYYNYVIEQSSGLINQEDACELMSVINSFDRFGKQTALRKFDELAQKIVKRNDMVSAVSKIGFLAGALVPNGILSKEESDALSKSYIEKLVFSTMGNTQENKKN